MGNFQKRFTGGICDLEGVGQCFVGHPIVVLHLSQAVQASDALHATSRTGTSVYQTRQEKQLTEMAVGHWWTANSSVGQ